VAQPPVDNILFCQRTTSLSGGYVNFHSVSDAERALDTLNYSSIKARFAALQLQSTVGAAMVLCLSGPCLPHHVEPTRSKPSQELLGGI